MPQKTPSKKTTSTAKKSSSRGGNGTHKKNVKKKPSGKKTLPAKLIKYAFVAALWVGIILSCILVWYAVQLPGITQRADFTRKWSITVEDANGETLARYGEMVGDAVTVAALPSHVPQAVLAIEDRRFYRHGGVDPLGILRAVVANIMHGGVKQGGSTITQQLAKNLFLTHERSYKRKIQEAMLAVWLESKLSKDEILSAYLNRVYLGAGTYGVDAAAQLYFNKRAKELTLAESALIAGLLKAPSRYSPSNDQELSKQRMKVVLQAMVDAGYISKDKAANAGDVEFDIQTGSPDAQTVRYFSDWAIEQMDVLLSGIPEEDIVIRTTLSTQAQRAAEKALVDTLDARGEEHNVTQGAVIVLTRDGAIKAMVGGRNYKESQFNRATQARRPPGSSFKPFVYLTALEHGWTPNDVISDAQIGGSYNPANFGNKYYGNVSLQTALTLSLNTVAVKLARDVGIGEVIKTARTLGITSDLEPDLSLALGSSGVSVLELASAYAALPNGGRVVRPYGITRITGEDGRVLYQKKEIFTPRPQFDPANVMALNAMMQRVVEEGTGQGARIGIPVSGKTGTSQDYRDAWFAGFTADYTGVVWLGNDDNSSGENLLGGVLPAQIWAQTISPLPRLGNSFPAGYEMPQTQQSRGQDRDGGLGGVFQRLFGGDGGDIQPRPDGMQPEYNQ